MSYCHEHGIPHSHLLGGPNAWTPEDRAKVVAYIMEKGQTCTMCGTAQWEWDEDGYAYEPVMHVCIGCQKKDSVTSDDEYVSKPGQSVVLMPKAIAQAMAEQPKQRRGRRRRENVAE